MGTESGEFHCWYSSNIQEARKKGQYAKSKFGKYLKEPIVDLGCGEGALLLALRESGTQNVLGVESNNELADLAASWGTPIVRKDLLTYVREERLEVATYVYADVVEHVPFEVNMEVLGRLPVGSRLVLQTPHTETLRGHQYYLNVPSHLAAYSPFVLKRMFERKGYAVVAEASVDDIQPVGWQRTLRGLIIRKILALPPEMVLGGGNYLVIADRLNTG